MKYLILANVKNEDIEEYIKSTNSLKISGIELIQPPHILYQSVDEARCITIFETESITKGLMFCQSQKPVESITLKALIEGKEALEKITKFETEKKKIIIDESVTTDPYRIIKFPNTLHGKTGLIASKVFNLSNFSPLKASTFFSNEIYENVFNINLEELDI